MVCYIVEEILVNIFYSSKADMFERVFTILKYCMFVSCLVGLRTMTLVDSLIKVGIKKHLSIKRAQLCLPLKQSKKFQGSQLV